MTSGRSGTEVATGGLGDWRPSTPGDAAEWLSACTCSWWLAGGRALDEFLGGSTRRHEDLDVGCLRRDLPDVLRALSGWEWFAAHDGELSRLRIDELPGPAVHSLWGRLEGTRDWHLELLLDEAEGKDWVFRRDRTIRRPLAELTWKSAAGIRVLRPEVQLLYKAKAPRPRDEGDFSRIVERLDSGARSWLRGALERAHAGHPWLRALTQ